MGFGYLESVYEKCLGIEFQKAGLKAKFQQPITVYYDDKVVGKFSADKLLLILLLSNSRRSLVSSERMKYS